jgi:phosphopantothenate synthetase
MTEKDITNISLVDEILNNMLLIIERREEFDEKSITNLKKLAEKEELDKAKKVIDAIKAIRGENCETD